jgi:hypothetical protein
MKRLKIYVDGKVLFDASLADLEQAADFSAGKFIGDIDITNCRRLMFAVEEVGGVNAKGTEHTHR